MPGAIFSSGFAAVGSLLHKLRELYAIEKFERAMVTEAEQSQVDRIGHRLVTRVIRMQVIAAIVKRQELGRLARIARHPVEVDNAVELAAGTDEMVNRLAFGSPS